MLTKGKAFIISCINVLLKQLEKKKKKTPWEFSNLFMLKSLSDKDSPKGCPALTSKEKGLSVHPQGGSQYIESALPHAGLYSKEERLMPKQNVKSPKLLYIPGLEKSP